PERYASPLALAGAGHYTVRASRRAAALIRPLDASVAEFVRTSRVRELRGIGPGIEARLRELVETGEIAHARELEGEVEPELVGLGRYLGLTPQRAVELGRALSVRTAADLRTAIRQGRVRTVHGFGPKTEARLRAALEREDEPRPRR